MSYDYTEDLSPQAKVLLQEELTNSLNRHEQVKVPKPPKKGEYIRCQQCGKVMMPEDFSEDPKIRKKEFKWHLHYKCQQELIDRCDRETVGLLSQRNRKY